MTVSTENAPSERLSLEIPPDPMHIMTARLFAGAAVRSLERGEEVGDVLRLVLSEMCTESIEQGRRGRIVIELAPTNPMLVTFVALGRRDPDGALRSDPEAAFRQTLIDAVIPNATFNDEPDRWTVTFSL